MHDMAANIGSWHWRDGVSVADAAVPGALAPTCLLP